MRHKTHRIRCILVHYVAEAVTLEIVTQRISSEVFGLNSSGTGTYYVEGTGARSCFLNMYVLSLLALVHFFVDRYLFYHAVFYSLFAA